MVRDIFVNLPVKHLPKAIAFFTELGFTFNPQYTDDTATCMILGEHIYAMLLTEEKFQGFTPKALCNANTHSEVLTCLAVADRETVDSLVSKALAAGGRTLSEPKDYGFMYQHGFEDLDGHIWELVALQEEAVA